MTRLITDDLETGSGLWDSSVSATVVSDIRAHGTYGVRLGAYGRITYNLSAITEWYSRFYFFTEDTDQLIMIAGGQDGPTIFTNIRRDGATKKLRAYMTNTLKATGSINIEPSTWYLIEWYWKSGDTDGRHIVKVNGQTDIDFTGDTNGSYTSAYNFSLHKSVTGYGLHWFDDIALNDVNGGSDNSWIGRYPGINLLGTFADLTLDAAGIAVRTGSLAKTLGNMTLAGTAKNLDKGALSETLEPLTFDATAKALIKAALAQTLDDTTSRNLAPNSYIRRASAIQFLRPFVSVLGQPGAGINGDDRAIMLSLYAYQFYVPINAVLSETLQNVILDAYISLQEGRVYGPAVQSG